MFFGKEKKRENVVKETRGKRKNQGKRVPEEGKKC